MSKELRISKIQDKIEGLEVKGQGCRNDCKQGHWSGNNSYYTSGCKWVVEKPNTEIVSFW